LLELAVNGCSCDNFVDLVLVLDREACVSTKQEICFRYKNYRQMTPLKTIIKDLVSIIFRQFGRYYGICYIAG
jgi:hypothetical protein